MDEDFYGRENKVYDKDDNKSHYESDGKSDERDFHKAHLNSNNSHEGTLVSHENAKIYVILGWVSAALTFFISPLFAVAGIAFGVLLNRQIKGSGNTLIIANVALGLINLILGVVFVLLTERMIGY